MEGPFLRKYGESTTINFELFEVDGVNFRTDAAHSAGDSVIMKDEGAEANTSNGFTDEGTGYSLVLTATEMQAARIKIYFIDQTATKVWLDKSITIETYGHASAQHAFDLDTAQQDVTVASMNADVLNAAAIADAAITAAAIAADAIGASELATDAVNEIRDSILSDSTPFAGANVDAAISSRATAGDIPSVAGIADGVWDEALAGHVAAGSAGERLGRIPNAAAGGNGGVPTVDANNRIVGIQGTKNTLDDLQDLSATQVNAQVDTALSDIRLDELMATALASQPAAGSVFGDLTEDDGGTQRFTTNALENGPSGGGGGTDWTTGEKEQIRSALGVDGTKTAATGGQLQTLDGNVDTLIVNIPDVISLAAINAQVDTALSDYGANTTTPPTAAAITAAVWDDILSGHTIAGSAGERLGRIPNAAAGGNGGLPTVNASNQIAGIAGTKNTLDDLQDLSATQVNAQVVDVMTVDQLVEGYAADGATATFAQLAYMTWSFLSTLEFVGTTGTARQLDGSTAAMTFTIDDAANPTEINRTT